MLAVNKSVAVGMEQYSVFIGIWPSIDTRLDVMVMPSRFPCDFLVADRTNPVLFFA